MIIVRKIKEQKNYVCSDTQREQRVRINTVNLHNPAICNMHSYTYYPKVLLSLNVHGHKGTK